MDGALLHGVRAHTQFLPASHSFVLNMSSHAAKLSDCQNCLFPVGHVGKLINAFINALTC